MAVKQVVGWGFVQSYVIYGLSANIDSKLSLHAISDQFLILQFLFSSASKCRSTHTQPFNSPLSGTTQVGWYQKKRSPMRKKKKDSHRE